MIEHLVIDNVASYDGLPQQLKGLSIFNYLYGANGAGKTTISKIISEPDKYPTCQIKWKDNNKLVSYVYNKDFVENNFSQDNIKGVFTLGKDIKNDQEKLLKLNDEQKKIRDSIVSKRKLIDGEGEDIGAVKQLEKLEKEFKDDCWKKKVKYDDVFSKSFLGLRNSSEKFKARVLIEYKSNTSDVLPIDELTHKAEKVFSDELTLHSKMPIPNMNLIGDILSENIWSERIVGKKDVGVADLIGLLNNSDWVKKGLDYYEKSTPQCPLCQQVVSNDIFDSIKLYFDETYESKKKSINEMTQQYEYQLSVIQSLVGNVKSYKSPFVNYDTFDDKANLLLSSLFYNLELVKNKQVQLSEVITFKNIDAVVDDFILFLNDANRAIEENNDIFNNKKVESDSLSNNFWAYLVKSELKSVIDKYSLENSRLERKIAGLNVGIAKDNERLDGLLLEIERIESNQTSIIPTVHKINDILNSYGFKNFHLKPADDKIHYVIVRDSGDNARTTLSEGEKTFITFLYYYCLVRGSESATGVLNDRVVVFDDPISSLDSDILFIVSSMIKDLMDDVRNKSGSIKQIIFLTHNIYFHKELTFNPDRRSNRAMNEETFWVVRKKGRTSYLESCEFNPIKTSYDLLWSELRRNDINSNTIQNTMRRILENYYKILGGMDIRKLECNFDGGEKVIFRSLVSWINDGSHFSGDDLYMNLDEASIEKNMIVFQKIFEKSEHTAHFKMMMGDFYKPLVINVDNVPEGEVEIESGVSGGHIQSEIVIANDDAASSQDEVPF